MSIAVSTDYIPAKKVAPDENMNFIQPIKLTTTRWRMVCANRKSTKAFSGDRPTKSPLFCGLTWMRRHTRAGKGENT